MISNIPKINHTNSGNFFVMAGPCAIEGEDMAFKIANKILDITSKLEIPFIFKGSFKKANRSRLDSFTGIGDEKALTIQYEIEGSLADYPVLNESDWCEEEAEEANEVWQNCYNEKERIDYVREHSDQFYFSSWSDLRNVIRGEYFTGYASELLA